MRRNPWTSTRVSFRLAANNNITSTDACPPVTAPAPAAFMKSRPPARARSPPKTNLKSPARRAPGLSSSPLRASNVVRESPSGAKSVQRRLDFKNNPLANRPVLPKPNGVRDKGKAPAATNGHRSSSKEEHEAPEHEEESMAMLDGGGDDYGVEDDDEDGELELELERELEEEQALQQTSPPSAKKNRGRPKKAPTPIEEQEEEEDDEDDNDEAIFESIEEETEPAEDSEPVRAGKKRGRPPGKANHADDDIDRPAKKKPKGNSDLGGDVGESSNEAAAPRRRGRPPKSATVEASEGTEPSIPANKRAIPKHKRPIGNRSSPAVGDTSVAEVPRGPPLPRSRGLVITRRETPGAASMHTTRSGRTSYQPLAFWKNERAELDDEALLDDGKSKIVLPHIKEIVRIDELEPEEKGSRRRGQPSGKKSGRRRGGFYDDDDDDDLEEWEQEGDIIMGEVVVWQPEHEFNPPGPDEQIEVAPDEQIAVSANAIMTREIRNASFKFAKTLSMPFFGSGVVDLPPGTEKKPKNSRKMHMTFFVFAGRVQVTVADTVFSIGRGGMWFVPRGEQGIFFTTAAPPPVLLLLSNTETYHISTGNYYSIENISNKPARIFFSQGCEVASVAAGDVSQVG